VLAGSRPSASWPAWPAARRLSWPARRDITEQDVISGIRIAGAATFVAEITADGTQALVY